MNTYFNKYTRSTLWILVFLITGVLFSGYHFIDDHEVYTFIHQLKFDNLLGVIKSTIMNDFLSRFRPFYYFYRVFLTSLFGENFLYYYLHNLIICVFSSLLLFNYAQKLKQDSFTAFVFTIISIGGLGFSIYYRLGVNETMGVFFLALGLNYSLSSKKTAQLISLCSFIIASFCKESFVLLIPIVALWQVYTQSQTNDFKQFIASIKQKAGFLIFFGLLAFIQLCLIIFKVGTNKIGYAGAPTAFDLPLIINVAKSFFRLFIQNNLFILFPIYLIYKKTNWKQNAVANVLIAIMLAMQFLVYAKSGMYERYLLPSGIVVGLFYLINMPTNPSKSFKIISIIMATWSLGMAFYQTNKYAKVGEENQVLLSEILKKTKAETSIIIAGSPLTNGEWMLAMDRYFSNQNHQRNNISYLVIPENYTKEIIGETKLPAYTFKQANQDLSKSQFAILITPKENEQNLIQNHNGKDLHLIFETESYKIFE